MTNPAHRVSETPLIRVYCVLRQAERSIDFLRDDDWPHLRKYYSGARQRYLEDAVSFLEREFGLASHSSPAPDLYPPQSRLRTRIRRAITRSAVRGGLNRSRRSLLLHKQEAAWIHAILFQAKCLLKRPARPAQEEVIELRLRLSHAQRLLRRVMGETPALLVAERVEHYETCRKDVVSMEEAAGSVPGTGRV